MYVTPVEPPNRAERAIVGVILVGCFFANSGHFCARGGTLLVKVWFHKLFDEQYLILLIYCDGLLSAAGDTKESLL